MREPDAYDEEGDSVYFDEDEDDVDGEELGTDEEYMWDMTRGSSNLNGQTATLRRITRVDRMSTSDWVPAGVDYS
jgi:hypothetical protein